MISDEDLTLVNMHKSNSLQSFRRLHIEIKNIMSIIQFDYK